MSKILYEKLNIKNIPTAPGVYLMRDNTARIIYIGKAGNLKKRIISYFRDDGTYKTHALINSLKHIDFILAASESEALILEEKLIKKFRPYYNVLLKDDKTYPFLKITIKEDFPKLIFTRKKLNDGNLYFGPYPHVNEIKKIYSWMRNIFSWRFCNYDISENNLPKYEKVKSCLYLHTKKCLAPCVGKITSKDYKSRMNEISLFLGGRYSVLLKKWKKDMKIASRKLEFENAQELRDRISALETSTQRVTMREVKPEDLENLKNINDVLSELKEMLNLSRWPVVIEGFDISNISGTDSVASMVRFQNGKPDKNNYRKYLIKTVVGSNDPAMIAEAVGRRYLRLKKEQASYPDLILIDGGKTQLQAAKEALNKIEIKIPIISLAKKDEEVYLDVVSEPLKPSSDSKALQLLQYVRDEAHRFAVAYHHNRRGIRYEGRVTKGEGRKTWDEGRGTKDEGRRARDEGQNA